QACSEPVTLKARGPSPWAGSRLLSEANRALTLLAWTPPPRVFQVELSVKSTSRRLMLTAKLLAVGTSTVREAELILAPAGIWPAAVPKRLSKRIGPSS